MGVLSQTSPTPSSEHLDTRKMRSAITVPTLQKGKLRPERGKTREDRRQRSYQASYLPFTPPPPPLWTVKSKERHFSDPGDSVCFGERRGTSMSQMPHPPFLEAQS